MINRDRMNETEWLKRIIAMRDRCDRDAENAADLATIMQTGSWNAIAWRSEDQLLREAAEHLHAAFELLEHIVKVREEQGYKSVKSESFRLPLTV